VARAQATLGWAYLQGEGVPRDVPVAIKWFEAAAAQGHAYSLFNLAMVYGAGWGAPKDEERAWKLADKAAAFRHPEAMAGVARHMLTEPAEQRNLPRAIRYLIAAADADQQHAIYMLGRQYHRGNTGRDAQRAFQALQRASDRQSLAAQVWIAQAYARGLGVAADAARAEELFRLVQTRAPPAMVNAFSWDLAVAPEQGVRDADRAIALMKSLLADPKEITSNRLDTLAAAYAAGGQFADAIATQLLALEKVAADSRRSGMIELMKSRLELYRSGQAYTERP
jgi:TPR repeat protein